MEGHSADKGVVIRLSPSVAPVSRHGGICVADLRDTPLDAAPVQRGSGSEAPYLAKRERRSRRRGLDVPARRLLRCSVILSPRVKRQAETERLLPGRAFGAF
jgi:hypothetical protein